MRKLTTEYRITLRGETKLQIIVFIDMLTIKVEVDFQLEGHDRTHNCINPILLDIHIQTDQKRRLHHASLTK